MRGIFTHALMQLLRLRSIPYVPSMQEATPGISKLVVSFVELRVVGGPISRLRMEGTIRSNRKEIMNLCIYQREMAGALCKSLENCSWT